MENEATRVGCAHTLEGAAPRGTQFEAIGQTGVLAIKAALSSRLGAVTPYSPST